MLLVATAVQNAMLRESRLDSRCSLADLAFPSICRGGSRNGLNFWGVLRK